MLCCCRFEGIIVDSVEANISRYDLVTICAKSVFHPGSLFGRTCKESYFTEVCTTLVGTMFPKIIMIFFEVMANLEIYQVIFNHTLKELNVLKVMVHSSVMCLNISIYVNTRAPSYPHKLWWI